jgi:tetratricopeptide (TPR) repeat protein
MPLTTHSLVSRKPGAVQLLHAVADEPEEALQRSLVRLRAGEFLYEARLFPDLEYTFKHALTHEVAYNTLLHTRRRELHRQIVVAIERLYAERVSEQVERLAAHAQRGELWQKAAVYLPQAGAKAAALGSSEEAAICLEQALAALNHLPHDRVNIEQAIDVRIEQRNNLLVHSLNAAALECISQAETAARGLQDRRRLARVLAHKTHSLWLEGEFDDAIGSGREALSLGQELDDFSVVIAATQYLGQVHRTIGQYPEAIALFRRNVEALQGARTADRLGMHALPAVLSRGFLADSLSALGKFSEAVNHGRDAVEIAESVGHPFSIVAAHAVCGRVPRPVSWTPGCES